MEICICILSNSRVFSGPLCGGTSHRAVQYNCYWSTARACTLRLSFLGPEIAFMSNVRMVKELKLEGCIEGMNPQAVFSLLFGDGQFFRRYHEEHGEDTYADVSDWTADNRRTIKFSAAVNAPSIIKKAVGVDILKVTDMQTHFAIGDTFTIVSTPTVEHPQGFNATVKMALSPMEMGEGCVVTTSVMLECKAAVWGVQGTIESFMERKAKKIFMGWLRFAHVYLKEQAAKAAGVHYPEKEDDDVSTEAAAIDDEFFDFSEEDERALMVTGESRSLGEVQSKEGEAGLQTWIMQSVMSKLNGLHITCDASRSHVEELNRRLQKIEEEIRVLQKQLQGGSVEPLSGESGVWKFVVTCIVAGMVFRAGDVYWRSQMSKNL